MIAWSLRILLSLNITETQAIGQFNMKTIRNYRKSAVTAN